ncbi:hypothetical protein EST38_g9354 [Candolleomyces aberdarensis]|uniref:Uncharacterized protein n=1 Tax=Candolleomyces aberdarensis TaxID=2316362 RepID=A0A4Q2DA47_9AGAR|nr:hypothetical protein EST38_g9354 [Candolleomyces aberdarensis]
MSGSSHAGSQGPSGTRGTLSSGGGGPATDNTKRIRVQTEQCEQLVHEVLDGKLMPIEFVSCLHEHDLISSDAEVYVQQLEDLLRTHGPAEEERHGDGISQPATPDGLEGQELEDFRRQRDEELRAAEE